MNLRKLFAVVAMTIAVIAVAGATTIHIPDPLVVMESRDLQREANELIPRALAEAARRLDNYANIRIGGAARGADVTIQLIVVESDSQPIVTMQLTSSSGAAGTYNYGSSWVPNTYQELAAGIVYLYLEYVEEIQPSGDPPESLSVLRLGSLYQVGLGPIGAGYPIGLAVDTRGELLIAMNTYVVRVDRYYRELAKIGGRFLDRVESFAYRIFTSPSGEITTLGTGGTSIWRIPFDEAEPRAVPLPGNNVYGGALATDGSLVMLDPMRQVGLKASPDNTIEPINLMSNPYIFPQVIAAGPEATLWTWDAFENRIVIFDVDGNRIGGIIPLIPYEDRGSVNRLVPYPDGTFAIVTMDHLLKFDRSGKPEWSLPAQDVPGLGSFYGQTDVAFDPATGIIYVLSSGQQVFQLLDVEYARRLGSVDPTDLEILALTAQLGPGRNNPSVLKELARIYERLEAWELASDHWRLVDSFVPGDSEAEMGMRRADVEFTWREVIASINRAERSLKELGPANARPEYEKALQAIERLIHLVPGDEEALQQREDLQVLYAQAYKPLEIVNIEIEELFPSLYQLYQAQPVGRVVVRNENETVANNVRVAAQLQQFMSTPWVSDAVPVMTSGSSHGFEIRLPLESTVLHLTATMNNAPLTVTVQYELENTAREVVTVEAVVVHRNTALTWDDSGKLASFVIPTDTYVREFSSAFSVVDRSAGQWDISEKLLRAMRIADAVGSHGIEYIEDPQSGISLILGSASFVDSVNYPRTTLRYRQGDCDDTTALLCSLYESVSIGTAIMTSPGHVFMAFDTGEPTQQQWMFTSDQTIAIPYNGTLWLPVETTILHDGFQAAWEEGSRLVRSYGSSVPADIPTEGADQIEFLPVSEQRQSYPELPDLPLSFDFNPPPDTLVGPLHATSIDGLQSTIYLDKVADFERSLRSQSDRQKLRTLNQLGVLHARFNQPGLAERSFDDAIDLDPDYTTSYINLANLRIINDEPRKAIALLNEVTDRRPGSVLANLLLAQASQMLGNQSEAREFMVIVEDQAPELASQYPHLSGGGAGRASEAQANPVLPWPVDEE